MWQYRAKDGFPTDWHLAHLGRFAMGGAGLVMQEGTAVTANHRGSLGDLGIWGDEFVEPLRRITRFIKDNGAVAGIQLMHAGRKARTRFPWDGRGSLDFSPEIEDWNGWEVVGATSSPHAAGYAVPRAMTLDDIEMTISAWGSAAARAHRAEYEVLEIHAGHGYLLHEFLSPMSNSRMDVYGGSFDNRIRFLVDVVERVRRNWPEEKPLLVRVSADDTVGAMADQSDKWSIEDTVRLARILKPLGVDAIDCSSGGLGATAGSPIEPGRPVGAGYQVPLASRTRRDAEIPTIAVGLIVSAPQASDIITSGQADMVALGRELLMNPNWPIFAAQELGVDPAFSLAPLGHDYYLSRREATLSASASRPLTRQVNT